VRFGREPEFSDAFYKSWPWKRCREGYLNSVGRLCERCGKKGLIVPADQVHHKIKLTPENLSDPAITLNWGNLEALCMDCHQAEHKQKRWRCEPDGSIRIL
jgi:5-methylcytosine-specific restriction endonuclease McrA